MILLQNAVLSFVFSVVSAQVLTAENRSYLVPIMIAVPTMLCVAFVFVYLNESKGLEENIIMGVLVVVFVEEGRQSTMTNDESPFITGNTPIAALADDCENLPTIYASSTTPSCLP
ncbi:hypothetical protein THRCLA_21137 [Thraustotheca clavata]|uniref:Drug/Metabolite Transporter (DMT) Superfamily n=1 Tax=Thraustotheca clavata TaxID=74557 RepID=A0A1V9ZZT2_9STRA|nr:hypothetical protein THRCLA_21137 [Thraustotheca clavata]